MIELFKRFRPLRYQFKLELEGRESARAAALSRWVTLPPEIAADYQEMLALLTPAFTPVEHLECGVEKATERFNSDPYARAWERVFTRATILDGIKSDRSFQQALAAGQLHQDTRKDKAYAQELARGKWIAQPDTTIRDMADTIHAILLLEKKPYKLSTARTWVKEVAPAHKPGRR